MIIDFATGKVKKPAPPETATPVSAPEPKKPHAPAKRKPASLPVENRRAELAKIHVAKNSLRWMTRRTGPCSCRSSA